MEAWSRFARTALTEPGLSISWPFRWTGYTQYKVSIMTLNRLTFSDHSTIGELVLDNQFQCYTLEDTCRKLKIPHVTAIPAGKYQVVINPSARFKRLMPMLLGVPGFEGVRIHPGNTDANTDGCVLVGRIKGVDRIEESQLAFNKLFGKLEDKLKEGKIWIDIIGGVHA